MPLVHPPGHAQVDFGEALAMIGGVERKIHFFAFDLPHSRCELRAWPIRRRRRRRSATATSQAFAFFGGVPQSILYDNTKIAVARILGDGKRQRTRVFSELQSHYLFEDRFGRPGKGNDKGKVEGLVGYARRNFLVPIPVFDELRGAERASARRAAASGWATGCAVTTETIGERLAARSCRLPAAAAGALRCLREDSQAGVSSLSLVRYRLQRLLGADQPTATARCCPRLRP